MTPADLLPSLVELSIAIAGFSGVAVAVQSRSERSAQLPILLTSLLWSTFNSAALSVLAMVLLASPLESSIAWIVTSIAHVAVLVLVLIVRSSQRRRGDYVRTRSLLIARVLLYTLVCLQLINVVLFREPWITISGLAFYCFFGFGFFVSLLLELVRPNAT